MPTAVNAGERLLMKKDFQVVFFSNPAHDVHHELVVIVGNIDFLKKRRHFKLARRYFIVTGATGIPSFQDSSSNSFMKSYTRDGIDPK